MDTEAGYNGWKNYPTWNVAMWIGNDEGLYNYAREMTADEIARGASENPHNLASRIQAWVCDELAPDLGASFAADLLGYALGEVDWHEIATTWIADEVPA